MTTSTGLALTNLSVNDAMTLAQSFARSGYFKDARDAAQAIVKIVYGQALGVPPAQSMMDVHIIEGKPAPSAGLTAALIKRSDRYDYEVIQADSTSTSLRFIERRGGERVVLGLAEYTLAEAQSAGVASKQNWQRYASDMLFARAITRGARRFCPDVFLGPVYTADELGYDGGPVDHFDADVHIDGRVLPPPAPKAARAADAVPAPVAALPDAMPADPAPEHWTPLIEAASQDIRALHALWERIPGETPNDFRRAGALALVVEAFAAEAEHAAAGGLKDAQRRWLSAELAEMGITMADAQWPAKSHAITRAAADRASAALDAVEAAQAIEEAA